MDIPGLDGAVTYSEATAELIDSEVKETINTQYAKAMGILEQRKAVLEKGAVLLLEKEKIEGGELKTLMSELPAKGD